MSDTARPAPQGVSHLLSLWSKLENIVVVIAFTLMIVLMFGDVLMRELVAPLAQALGIDGVPSGLRAAQPRALYLLIVAAFISIGVSVASAAQIVPTLAFNWIPKRLEPLVDRLSYLLSAVIAFIAAWYGWLFVRDSMDYPTTLSGLDWPTWAIQIVIPIGFLSAGGRYLIYAIWPASAPARPEVQE